MIIVGARLAVADNSGAKRVRCIKVLGGTHMDCARVGNVIVVSVIDADHRGKVKKGEVHRAIIVRTKKEFSRQDGSYLKCAENAVVLIEKKEGSFEPIGTRVFGPVSRELKPLGCLRIISLAAEVM